MTSVSDEMRDTTETPDAWTTPTAEQIDLVDQLHWTSLNMGGSMGEIRARIAVRFHERMEMEAAALSKSIMAGGDVMRPEVRAFAMLMEQQLHANDHKPGWKNDAPESLFVRVREEVQELAKALNRREAARFNPAEAQRQSVQVGLEAADVANMAMMVADVCGALAAAPAILSSEGATGWSIEDGRPVSEAPHACHVIAGYFDNDCGEWLMSIVGSPPSRPFTHWWPLPGAGFIAPSKAPQ